MMLLIYDTFKASDSKISSLKISLLRKQMKSLKNLIFLKLSSLCYKDKSEYCTVQRMIKNNHILEISNILNARAQSMLLIVTEIEFYC